MRKRYKHQGIKGFTSQDEEILHRAVETYLESNKRNIVLVQHIRDEKAPLVSLGTLKRYDLREGRTSLTMRGYDGNEGIEERQIGPYEGDSIVRILVPENRAIYASPTELPKWNDLFEKAERQLGKDSYEIRRIKELLHTFHPAPFSQANRH
ncbi:MAG: hypothetical protein ACE5ES_01165 [Candidatus Nanoarchaeia archaeon]